MITKHIGFIMDGNGRWAEAQGLPRTEGYAAGLIALRRVIEQCNFRGVQAVTVYAFSTENWARPDAEVAAILNVIEKFNNNYDGERRITYMGDFSALSDSLTESIAKIEQQTAENEGTVLNIALNYGGRDDIIHAAKICYDHGEFSDEKFCQALGSSHLPPLDLIVRTGGEIRLSNFMLYEAAYAELIFTSKLWPDIEKIDVDVIINEFEKRKRKFGAL